MCSMKNNTQVKIAAQLLYDHIVDAIRNSTFPYGTTYTGKESIYLITKFPAFIKLDQTFYNVKVASADYLSRTIATQQCSERIFILHQVKAGIENQAITTMINGHQQDNPMQPMQLCIVGETHSQAKPMEAVGFLVSRFCAIQGTSIRNPTLVCTRQQ